MENLLKEREVAEAEITAAAEEKNVTDAIEKNLFEYEETLYLASEKNESEKELAGVKSDKFVKTTSALEQMSRLTKRRKNRHTGYMLGEVKSLRTANSKVYGKSNGIKKTKYYPTAIHHFNQETQNFEEIDYSISEDETGEFYKSGKHNFIAKINRDLSTNELFTIEKGMHKITLKAKRGNKAAEKAMLSRLSSPRREASEKAANIENTGNNADINFFIGDTKDLYGKDCVVIENFARDVNLEYSICKKGVKENIIINQKCPVYIYSFILECENVISEYIEEENRIVFKSLETGKEVFYIPAPFMVDANGAISNDVIIELKPIKNQVNANNIQMTVIADPE